MAAPSETYVDPSIAGNSGAGTIGDPYGDLQYALNTMTRDATNGDRINILTGTDEVLTAALSLATYGTPSVTAPLIFQGYTSAAGDGGIGGISGNGTYAIINSSSTQAVSFVDMHLHNSGSTYLTYLGSGAYFYNVEFDNTTGIAARDEGNGHYFLCHFHNIGNIGCLPKQGSKIIGCTFENGTNDFVSAVQMDSWGVLVLGCVFDLDGTSIGINTTGSGDNCWIIGNSLYCNAGTGAGIEMSGGNVRSVVLNNIVEGFSGVGGVGLLVESTADVSVMGYNAFYNNTTNESISGDVILDLGNDQSLGASPFTNASSDDFTVGTGVRALAWPTANYPSLSVRTYLDIGALQRQEPAGGGGTTGKQGLHPIEAGAV